MRVIPSGVSSDHARRAAASAPAAHRIDTRPAPRPLRRSGYPTARMRKETAGSSRAMAARMPGSVMLRGSSPQEIEVVGDRGAPHPEDEDHEGEAEGDLTHRHRD